MRTWWITSLLILALASSSDTSAQAPRVEASDLATSWLQGRYFMPVKCLAGDGSAS